MVSGPAPALDRTDTHSAALWIQLCRASVDKVTRIGTERRIRHRNGRWLGLNHADITGPPSHCIA